MLLRECAAANVHIFLSEDIHEVEQDTAHHHFVVRTHTAAYSAPALVVATGGLSIPKMGATGFGYDLARQFGLSTLDCRPALVPMVLDKRDQSSFCDLAGISAEVVASIGKRTFREKLLITHRGLSGPAILQISSYWNGVDPVLIDWAGGREILAQLRSPHSHRDLASAKFTLRQNLPGRLAERLIDIAASVSSTNQRTNSLTNHAIAELERRLHAWAFTPAGGEGYAKAEVTAGGVNPDALSAKTMECRHVPGLYFIGEVVDVTGQLGGGFNFQWAWASGAAAGRAL